MAFGIRNILNIGKSAVESAAVRSNGSVNATRQATFKTAGFASIPYEKAPVVTDLVPTKDVNGNPYLAGYITPDHVWTA